MINDAPVPLPLHPLADHDLTRLAVRIALESARHGGGPFGAVIADTTGRIVEVGWNQVLATHDSTAHAEIMAIRRAERKLATHDLRAGGNLTLHSSCAPCIQCFGAIYWSGLVEVRFAAGREDAEALGFAEGPVSDVLWDAALREKDILRTRVELNDDEALAPFHEYRKRGGLLY